MKKNQNAAKQLKKLQLSRETLRDLKSSDVRNAEAGVPFSSPSWCETVPSESCFCCPTTGA